MSVGEAAPGFVLPASLASQGLRLRPETDGDLPFLMQLYASTREDELRPVPWSAEQKQLFLASQFGAQRHHYRTHIADCAFDVLEQGGERIGRLYLDARAARLHIVDISLMPEWRGKGLGTALLTALMDTGRAQGKAIGIMVEKFNPALRLYRRLGFSEIGDHEVYLEMEWRPEQAPAC